MEGESEVVSLLLKGGAMIEAVDYVSKMEEYGIK